jgi:cytochrome P450
VCPAETTVAPRTSRATTIPAGSSVLVATHAAMWDRTAVPDPSRFDATRASGQYLIFGHGEHRCLGEGIMREQLPAMLAPLLALDGLDRAEGSNGRLSWVGPAPDDLLVQFWR